MPERTHNRNVRPESPRLPVVEFNAAKECDDCHGLGEIDIDCLACDGVGCDDEGNPCSVCDGFGTDVGACDTCGGTGKADGDEST